MSVRGILFYGVLAGGKGVFNQKTSILRRMNDDGS